MIYNDLAALWAAFRFVYDDDAFHDIPVPVLGI